MVYSDGYEVVATDGEIELLTLEGEYDGHFDIALSSTHEIVGHISYSNLRDITYQGNAGYSIKEEYRGHGYAKKALNLLKNVMKEDGFKNIILTISPDNIASRKTAINTGAKLICYRPVPPSNKLYNYYQDGIIAVYKCDLNEGGIKK